jgi:hypothetical protein
LTTMDVDRRVPDSPAGLILVHPIAPPPPSGCRGSRT